MAGPTLIGIRDITNPYDKLGEAVGQAGGLYLGFQKNARQQALQDQRDYEFNKELQDNRAIQNYDFKFGLEDVDASVRREAEADITALETSNKQLPNEEQKTLQEMETERQKIIHAYMDNKSALTAIADDLVKKGVSQVKVFPFATVGASRFFDVDAALAAEGEKVKIANEYALTNHRVNQANNRKALDVQTKLIAARISSANRSSPDVTKALELVKTATTPSSAISGWETTDTPVSAGGWEKDAKRDDTLRGDLGAIDGSQLFQTVKEVYVNLKSEAKGYNEKLQGEKGTLDGQQLSPSLNTILDYAMTFTDRDWYGNSNTYQNNREALEKHFREEREKIPARMEAEKALKEKQLRDAGQLLGSSSASPENRQLLALGAQLINVQLGGTRLTPTYARTKKELLLESANNALGRAYTRFENKELPSQQTPVTTTYRTTSRGSSRKDLPEPTPTPDTGGTSSSPPQAETAGSTERVSTPPQAETAGSTERVSTPPQAETAGSTNRPSTSSPAASGAILGPYNHQKVPYQVSKEEQAITARIEVADTLPGLREQVVAAGVKSTNNKDLTEDVLRELDEVVLNSIQNTPLEDIKTGVIGAKDAVVEELSTTLDIDRNLAGQYVGAYIANVSLEAQIKKEKEAGFKKVSRLVGEYDEKSNWWDSSRDNLRAMSIEKELGEDTLKRFKATKRPHSIVSLYSFLDTLPSKTEELVNEIYKARLTAPPSAKSYQEAVASAIAPFPPKLPNDPEGPRVILRDQQQSDFYAGRPKLPN